jgi:lipoprotein-anchoring transpeptidase ErfK/SrfK
MKKRHQAARVAAAAILAGAGLIAAALATGAGRTPPAPAPTARALPRAAAPRPTPSPPPSPSPSPETALTVRSVLPIPTPFRHGDWYWDESAAPAAGPVVVTVDLQAQVLSAFRDGHEIGTAVIICGAGDKPTPLGSFRVSQKDADHVSNLYNAPMPYMLRLTNDGVSIHGSDHVGVDWATHGCVGVPVPFARHLFGAVGMGTQVIVTSGKRLEVGGATKAA